MTDSSPLERQLDAYNAHDVSRFLTAHAPDVAVTTAAGDVLMSGRHDVGKQYAGLFTLHPDLHVETQHRIEVDGWVIEQRRVTAGGHEMTALTGFHIVDGLIQRVVIFDASVSHLSGGVPVHG